jgi:hypothetical protein
LDLQSFLAGGSLDENVKNFTREQLKGVFPYEILKERQFFGSFAQKKIFEKYVCIFGVLYY